MKYVSRKTLHFPKSDFVVQEGVPFELPADKDVAAAIKRHPAIKEHKAKATQ